MPTDGAEARVEALETVTVEDGTSCDGSLRWRHAHAGETHAARVWVKTYSAPPGGGLLSTLQ